MRRCWRICLEVTRAECVAAERRCGPSEVVAVNINVRKSSFRKALRVLDDYEIEFVFDWKKKVSRKYDVDGIPHIVRGNQRVAGPG